MGQACRESRQASGAVRELPQAALVALAVAALAAGGMAIAGIEPWMCAVGGALAGVAASLAASGRAGSAVGAAPAPQPAPSPASNDSVLRRAIEVRCDERTAILEHLLDAVVLVDGHGETR
ncbi:MAG: hypothetical protein RL325_169, partial [Planctomycetota bacterium]